MPSRYLLQGLATSCGCEEKAPRFEDLTGRRFGMLTVLRMERDRDRQGKIQWLCRCDCGGQAIATGSQLRAGNRKSCGCLSKPPLKDWVGRQFGQLTVLAYDGKRKGAHYWKCRCSCGNEATVAQSQLLRGKTTSCGCKKRPQDAIHFVDGTSIEAIRSRKLFASNTSGVRGVYMERRTGKWVAQITFRGKTRNLGTYPTIAEAKKARERGEEVFDDFLARYDAGPSGDAFLEKAAN